LYGEKAEPKSVGQSGRKRVESKTIMTGGRGRLRTSGFGGRKTLGKLNPKSLNGESPNRRTPT